MSLHVIETHDRCPVGAEALDALRRGLAQAGGAVLLVPSFSQATDAQRQLAGEPGLALGVTVTTPDAWVDERWEVWGDGRRMATARERVALMRLALGRGEGTVVGTAGSLSALCRVAREAAPWVPAPGSPAWEALGEGDRAACVVIHRYLGLIDERGLVERAEATVALARALPSFPPIVVAVEGQLPRPLRELLQAGAEAGAEVSLVCTAGAGEPAKAPEAGVRLLEAAGPLAEWELVAREVRSLADGGARMVVVAAADATLAWRELAPRLAARGMRAVGAPRTPAGRDATVTAFMGFAQVVARLAELDATWPAPQEGPEGPIPQLGDMSWWPPRALTDFLLCEASGAEASRAWALDARWRANRSLTPEEVLAQLQRESLTSRPVAQATAQVLRGRVGTAALHLARALPADGTHAAQAAALACVQDAARTLGGLGIGAQNKGGITSVLPLTELVSLLGEVLEHVTLGGHVALGDEDAPCEVRICSRAEAARLEPGSADALVATNLTAAEWPLAPEDGAARALLDALGMEPPESPLIVARRQMSALMAVPTGSVLLERCLHDASAQPTYPAVMLSEVMGSAPAEGQSQASALAEADVSALLSASGAGARAAGSLPTAPAGSVGPAAQGMVIVPREGQAELPGGLPALSASQIETYLECPYKWFTLRRLGLEDQDATFSAVQEGSYAHRVLEVARRTLAQEAAERAGLVAPGVPLAQAGDAVTFVPGAAITEETLPQARDLVRQEMARHLAHQRMGATTLAAQSLVPHSATEGYRLGLLESDLLSELDFELGRLAGFSPRHFELRFGGSRPGSAHVTYAGADFVGSIDRVDVDAHGRAVVIDYKHKGAAGFAAEYDAFGVESPAEVLALELPRRVQSLIYAQVVRRMHPELKVVGAVYLSTRGGQHRRHEIAGMLDADAAGQVMGSALSDARWGHLVAGGWGKMGFAEVLDAVEEQVAARIARLVAGHIEAEPVDAHACSWCPVANCERRLS